MTGTILSAVVKPAGALASRVALGASSALHASIRLGRWCNPRATHRVGRRELPALLRAFTGAFSSRYARADAEFVDLARALRGLHANAQSLADLVNARLAGVGDALSQSRIGGSGGLAAKALAQLRAALDEASTELDALRSVSLHLRRLHSQLGQIERIGQFVHASIDPSD